MKLLIYADPHFSSYSSIVRSRGEKYSTRLENLIKTLNWIETTATKEQCDTIVCLGDFFDKCDLNSEELTALQEICWSNIRHYYITGNHEMGRSNLEFSSSHLFNLCSNTQTVDKVSALVDNEADTNIVFLPYVLETNRQPLLDYLKPYKNKSTVIVLSHNDIAGVQMGQYLSKDGFTVDEIEENCNLFINGHLHNGSSIGNKIINLGNITGQNFSEDAYTYKHQCLVLNTTTHDIQFIENPHAFHFYKINAVGQSLVSIQSTLSYLKTNSIVTIKVSSELVNHIKSVLDGCSNIIEYRLLIDMINAFSEVESSNVDLGINHIDKFIDYVKTNLGVEKTILDELNNVAGNVI